MARRDSSRWMRQVRAQRRPGRRMKGIPAVAPRESLWAGTPSSTGIGPRGYVPARNFRATHEVLQRPVVCAHSDGRRSVDPPPGQFVPFGQLQARCGNRQLEQTALARRTLRAGRARARDDREHVVNPPGPKRLPRSDGRAGWRRDPGRRALTAGAGAGDGRTSPLVRPWLLPVSGLVPTSQR